MQYVGFRIDRSEYAVAIRHVQEIILLPAITRLPQSPPEVEGLINLRGSILPIMNLRKRFGLDSREFDDETRIVVVNVGTRTVGLLVDAVSQVMRVSENQVQPPPPGIVAFASSAISGLIKDGDRLVVVLEVGRLFDDLRLDSSQDRVGAGSGGDSDPGQHS